MTGVQWQRSCARRAHVANARFVLRAAALAITCIVLVGCNGGIRPTLVQDAPPTPEPQLELDLPPAPETVAKLPVDETLALESSVDDALRAWADATGVNYLDNCDVAATGPEQLCDSPTIRDTVRLIGPSSREIWYVVTVLETDSFELGTGYRVNDVSIAGR